MISPRTRHFKIVAQDPSIKRGGQILTAKVEVPAEDFGPGPHGYRVHVIDYDSSTGSHYIPLVYPPKLHTGHYQDPFEKVDNEVILENPHFHAQNVYAIIMRILARFEFSLGRRVNWGFDGHQINVAPHAFADANAFYSRHDKALMFGYFKSPFAQRDDREKTVFTCLSHDVVAHETTHALLDGMRNRYILPSSPEQAGFHEGFSDVVALLSIFSLREVVSHLIDLNEQKVHRENEQENKDRDLINTDHLTKEALQKTALIGLAEEMGTEISGVRGRALRRSSDISYLKKGDEPYLNRKSFEEPHRCGELLVAAVMDAFLNVWVKRIARLKRDDKTRKFLDRSLTVEAGAEAADHLLTMAVRALDYTPPTDIKFGDFLSALLTADFETVPDDSTYEYRKQILESFKSFGIKPASLSIDGLWGPEENNFTYDGTHFESLINEPHEVFRFIWDNRKKLNIDDRAYTKVQFVRPSLRVAPDGFVLRETVAEYVQIATVKSQELQQLYPPIGKPARMPRNLDIEIFGGGTLIFDEYGRLKYHIANRIFSQTLQADRIDYLWKYGHFRDYRKVRNVFSRMHLRRSAIFSSHFVEEEF